MEAAAAALAVELWLVARKRPVTRRRLWAAYGGLAALTLMATLLVFLLPGLLAFDVVRRGVATDGDRWLRRALAAGVGAVAGLHYLFFLAPQSRLVTGTEGFSAMYAPFSSGATPTLRFVREAGLWFLRLPTSAGFLPPDVYEGEVDLSAALWPPVSRVAMAGVAVALAFGVVATRRRADLRPVPVALALALVVQLVVSGDERWPFGANPTNLFLLPLMAFLIAAGIAWMAGHARHSRTLTVLVCGVSLAIAAAVPLQAARLAQLRRDGAGYPLFVGLRDAVVQVRGTAGPTDVVVVSSPRDCLRARSPGGITTCTGTTAFLCRPATARPFRAPGHCSSPTPTSRCGRSWPDQPSGPGASSCSSSGTSPRRSDRSVRCSASTTRAGARRGARR